MLNWRAVLVLGLYVGLAGSLHMVLAQDEYLYPCALAYAAVACVALRMTWGIVKSYRK